jgi:hypothetical protein
MSIESLFNDRLCNPCSRTTGARMDYSLQLSKFSVQVIAQQITFVRMC